MIGLCCPSDEGGNLIRLNSSFGNIVLSAEEVSSVSKLFQEAIVKELVVCVANPFEEIESLEKLESKQDSSYPLFKCESRNLSCILDINCEEALVLPFSVLDEDHWGQIYKKINSRAIVPMLLSTVRFALFYAPAENTFQLYFKNIDLFYVLERLKIKPPCSKPY